MRIFTSTSTRPVLIVCFCGCLVLFTGAQLSADDDLTEDDVEPAGGQVQVENAENSLFGRRKATAVPSIRFHLDEILRRKLDLARTRWRLSDQQVEKLEIVGNREIVRLFERIEKQKQRIRSARQPVDDLDRDNPLNRETAEIRSKVRSGPFGDDSLFAKILKQFLTLNQTADDEGRLESTSRPAMITLQNAAELARTGRLKSKGYRIEWNRDGSQVAFVEYNGKVETFSWPEMRRLRAHAEKNPLQDFKFSPIDDLVGVAPEREAAFIADLRTGEKVPLRSDETYCRLAFNASGKILATGGYSNLVTLWSVPEGKRIRDLAVAGTEGPLTPVFSPDGTMLAVGNGNGRATVFELSTGLAQHELPYLLCRQLKFDPSGATLAVVYFHGSLVLWDMKAGAVKREVQAFADELSTVDWSPDGRLLVTGGNHAPVTIWNADNLSILTELESPDWAYQARFSPEGTRLLVSGAPHIRSDDMFVEIWGVP